MTRRELYLGVAVGMEHPGATLTIMEKDGDRTKVYYTGTHPKGETISRLPFELLAAVPPVVNRDGDLFLPGQWWLERMDALWGRGEVDDDTRRAAKTVTDFAATVFAGHKLVPEGVAKLLRQLREEGVLSEGQITKALGVDRLTCREILDGVPVTARAQPEGNYYVHFNGHSWFVKEAEFFKSQPDGEWKKAWFPIVADSIEDARAKALAQTRASVGDRADFELYALNGDYWRIEAFERDVEGEYVNEDVHEAFVHWRAGRASLAQQGAAQPSADALNEQVATLLAQRKKIQRLEAELRAAQAAHAGADTESTQAARDVLAERRRQIEKAGYDFEHDDAHPNGEIAAYAAFYAMPPAARDWPATETGYGETFGEAIIPADWSTPKTGDRRGELVKAGALILAEIERIDRAEVFPENPPL